MKKYIYIFLIFWSCDVIENNFKEIKDFIPDNPSLIIKVDNLGKFKSDIKNNTLLNELSQTDLKFNFKKQIKLINDFQDESELIICLNENGNEKIFTIITKDSSNNHDLHYRNIGEINIYSSSLSTIKNIKPIQLYGRKTPNNLNWLLGVFCVYYFGHDFIILSLRYNTKDILSEFPIF